MKRTLALIGILIVITIALLSLAVSSTKPPKRKLSYSPVTTIQPTPVADTTISFATQISTIYASASASVPINIDTGINQVSAVQIELAYDPNSLSDINITPGLFLPNAIVLLNDKTNPGRLSYALTLTPSDPPIKGKGIVANLTMRKNPFASVSATTVSILPKSLVIAPGVEGSVLKSTNSTIVQFL